MKIPIESGLDPIHDEFVRTAQGQPSLSPEQQRPALPIEQIPFGSQHYVRFGGGRKDDKRRCRACVKVLRARFGDYAVSIACRVRHTSANSLHETVPPVRGPG